MTRNDWIPAPSPDNNGELWGLVSSIQSRERSPQGDMHLFCHDRPDSLIAIIRTDQCRTDRDAL